MIIIISQASIPQLRTKSKESVIHVLDIQLCLCVYVNFVSNETEDNYFNINNAFY